MVSSVDRRRIRSSTRRRSRSRRNRSSCVKSLAALRHGLFHRLRAGRPRHAGDGRVQNGPAGVPVAGRVGRCVRLAVRAGDGRGGRRVHPGRAAYEWTKLAFSRFQGAIAAVLYWVTNPLWVGGSLAFVATGRMERQLLAASPRARSGTTRSSCCSSGSRSAPRSSRSGAGSGSRTSARSCGVFVLGFFVVTATVIYGIDHGTVCTASPSRSSSRPASCSSRSSPCCCSTTSASSFRTRPRRRCKTHSATSRSRSSAAALSACSCT